ncbi:MAG: polymer-forming cytoskeletal protein [Thermotogae bacterium]|nr:polymer-forming cytoskeletal protein [Thermotogota bacterium]
MFGKKKKLAVPDLGPMELLLGENSKIVGDVEVKGSATIMGEIKGNLKVEGELTVGETGRVFSESVEALSLVCSGRIKTQILVVERAEFKGTAHFEGEIRYKVLVVEEGAVLQGKVINAVEVKENVQTQTES